MIKISSYDIKNIQTKGHSIFMILHRYYTVKKRTENHYSDKRQHLYRIKAIFFFGSGLTEK